MKKLLVLGFLFVGTFAMQAMERNWALATFLLPDRSSLTTLFKEAGLEDLNVRTELAKTLAEQKLDLYSLTCKLSMTCAQYTLAVLDELHRQLQATKDAGDRLRLRKNIARAKKKLSAVEAKLYGAVFQYHPTILAYLKEEGRYTPDSDK